MTNDSEEKSRLIPRSPGEGRRTTDAGVAKRRAETDELLRKTRALEDSGDRLGPSDRALSEKAGGSPSDDPHHRERELMDRAIEDERRQSDAEMAQARSARQVEFRHLRAQVDEERRAVFIAHTALDLRDEFLAIVGHDLRNPLNAIAMSTQLLQRFSSGDPRVVRISEDLIESIAQMERIISDLTDVAAIEAGKLSVETEPGDARTPIGRALENFQPVGVERGIVIQGSIPPEPLRARFDRGRILQVMQNLLGNAVKFTPNGGRISVEAERGPGHVEVRVRDSGQGIPHEELVSIFERFRQVEKRGRRGLGLGLYICRSIVEAHRGRIWAQSLPGEGSTFTFTLPPA